MLIKVTSLATDCEAAVSHSEPVALRLTAAELLLNGPCPALLVQATRNWKLFPAVRSVTL